MGETRPTSMDSKLKVSEVRSDADFGDIAEIIWDAFEHPFTPFLRIVYYLKSNNSEDRTKGKTICAQRILESHTADPNSHWIKINDSETGKMVACTNWNFYETSPYILPKDPPFATWWPEGDGRDFATKFYRQCVSHKPLMFNKPHLYLNVSATLPSSRRQGAGGKLLEWGLKWVDEMGFESFTEASDMGRSLYEHYGFIIIKIAMIDEMSMAIKDPSEE